MSIDYSLFQFAKGAPRVQTKAVEDRQARTAWQRVCDAVDDRDKRRCQVTGYRLTAGAVDAWQALERNHLEPRSRGKTRRYVVDNVLTVSRAVHQLIHAGALRVLNKRGLRATSVSTIDHVQWNRNIVPHGSEPVKIRKGLAVRP